MEDNPDYITILDHRNPKMRVVALMKYDKAQDSYVASWCSAAMAPHSATQAAKSTAAGLKLEIR